MASITFQPTPEPLAQPAVPVAVFRYNDAQAEFLPFCRVTQIEETEGAGPGAARFRYVFRTDELAPPDAFASWDQVWPIASTGPGVVMADDRILVQEFGPDGTPVCVFHGFAQIPQLDVSPETQQVTFQALSAAVRCWDGIFDGAYVRDGVNLSTVNDVFCGGLTARFNPEGKPNATPSGANGGKGDWTFPTFVDAKLQLTPDTRQLWSVSMAARYILGIGNPQIDYDTGPPLSEIWIENPDFTELDNLLDSRTPKPGEIGFDPSDPTTYNSAPIVCQDLDITGKTWPEALNLLLEPHGFAIAFRTEDDGNGGPLQWLDIYRKDDGTDATVVDLYYQAAGVPDTTQTNVNEIRLARDVSDLTNQIEILTLSKRYEIAVVLGPGFMITGTDANILNLHQFIEGDPSFPGHETLYRLFLADECGEGHWDWGTNAWATTPLGLDSVLGPPQDKVPQWVHRRRPPIRDLFTKIPSTALTYDAQLQISTDYTGPAPAIYDPAKGGTWRKVSGGFDLLEDRLGIKITIKDPSNWNIGPLTTTGQPFPDGKVNVVKSMAAPDTAFNKRFFLRLVCVIEGDTGLDAWAYMRLSSSTKYPITRADEARDRFKAEIIDVSSPYNTTGKDITNRDDTANAVAFAEARRLAHEVGPVAGMVTVPRLTGAYWVGDRVRSIVGRNPDVSLAGNLGTSNGESPVYPAVVKLTRVYDPHQAVQLQLSDRRAEPARRRTT